jgi:hypothetical protein
MRLSLIFAMLMMVIAACTPAASDPGTGELTVLSTEAPLPGSVEIEVPENGAIIYAETMFISGTASDLPDGGFQLEVVTASGEQLVETTVQPDDGSWQVELVHGYEGDPMEAQIFALPVDTTIQGEYDVETIAVSSQDNRPEGTFGSIISPGEGVTLGGDSIEVSGTASGLFENTLVVVLEDAEGSVLDEEILTITNPYFIDEMVWSATLETDGYTGEATIRAYYQDAQDGDEVTLDEVTFTLQVAAG